MDTLQVFSYLKSRNQWECNDAAQTSFFILQLKHNKEKNTISFLYKQNGVTFQFGFQYYELDSNTKLHITAINILQYQANLNEQD